MADQAPPKSPNSNASVGTKIGAKTGTESGAKSGGSAKIYTRGGDRGSTSLIGGSRVSKSHLRLEAYGTVDELNSILGSLMADCGTDLQMHLPILTPLLAQLQSIQSELFNVGSQLACEDEALRASMPTITSGDITALETAMDTYSKTLMPLKHFVLPGGCRAASSAHLARTVCRRAERATVRLSELSPDEKGTDNGGESDIPEVVIQYLNRLSDYLFVLARYLNATLGRAEPVWMGKSKA